MNYKPNSQLVYCLEAGWWSIMLANVNGTRTMNFFMRRYRTIRIREYCVMDLLLETKDFHVRVH